MSSSIENKPITPQTRSWFLKLLQQVYSTKLTNNSAYDTIVSILWGSNPSDRPHTSSSSSSTTPITTPISTPLSECSITPIKVLDNPTFSDLLSRNPVILSRKNTATKELCEHADDFKHVCQTQLIPALFNLQEIPSYLFTNLQKSIDDYKKEISPTNGAAYVGGFLSGGLLFTAFDYWAGLSPWIASIGINSIVGFNPYTVLWILSGVIGTHFANQSIIDVEKSNITSITSSIAAATLVNSISFIAQVMDIVSNDIDLYLLTADPKTTIEETRQHARAACEIMLSNIKMLRIHAEGDSAIMRHALSDCRYACKNVLAHLNMIQEDRSSRASSSSSTSCMQHAHTP